MVSGFCASSPTIFFSFSLSPPRLLLLQRWLFSPRWRWPFISIPLSFPCPFDPALASHASSSLSSLCPLAVVLFVFFPSSPSRLASPPLPPLLPFSFSPSPSHPALPLLCPGDGLQFSGSQQSVLAFERAKCCACWKNRLLPAKVGAHYYSAVSADACFTHAGKGFEWPLECYLIEQIASNICIQLLLNCHQIAMKMLLHGHSIAFKFQSNCN